MFIVVVLLSLVTLALNSAPRSISPDGRIAGGQDADIEDYPYQISLMRINRHFCGASIISSRWAVTAASCTDMHPANSLRVRVGSSSIVSGGQVVDVVKIHQHHNYSYLTTDYDIALLELRSDVTVGSGGAVITLADEDTIYQEGDNATATGWGYDTVYGDLSDQLRVVTVPYVTHEKCVQEYETVYHSVTDRMLCAGYDEGGKGACTGDFGGPLVIDGKLAGIASHGFGCASAGYPGIYANVPALRAFIRDISGI